MVTIEATTTISDAITLAIEHGFSRMPVLGETIDDVLGILYEKDLVRAERAGRGDEPVTRIVRKAHFVPETKKVDQVLREMQAGNYHMAVVIDEYGGTAGIVTLEDLLEELVGDIRDEFDVEEPDMEALGNGALRVHGRMPISDLNDLVDAELPDDDWDTVGGLIFNSLGHVPALGEHVDVDGYRLIVERMQGRRITRVRIAPKPEVPAESEGGDAG
jgi:CBS domain containing-hemolysin-like protein